AGEIPPPCAPARRAWRRDHGGDAGRRQLMKAWLCEQYGDPVSLVLRDVPARDPAPGEVQIAMRATGVTFGETLILKGQYQLRPALPFVPSSDLAGVVAAVGDGIDRFRVGDPVLGVSFSLAGGGLQQFCTLSEDQLFPMPAALDFIEAAALTSD